MCITNHLICNILPRIYECAVTLKNLYIAKHDLPSHSSFIYLWQRCPTSCSHWLLCMTMTECYFHFYLKQPLHSVCVKTPAHICTPLSADIRRDSSWMFWLKWSGNTFSLSYQTFNFLDALNHGTNTHLKLMSQLTISSITPTSLSALFSVSGSIWTSSSRLSVNTVLAASFRATPPAGHVTSDGRHKQEVLGWSVNRQNRKTVDDL